VTRHRRGALIVPLATIVALTAGSCSLGNRAQQRDAIAGSRTLLARAGPTAGTFSVQSRFVDLPGSISGVDQNALGRSAPILTADLVIDAQRRRAVVAGLGVDFSRFDDNVAFVRREQGQSSLGSQRPWSRLDFRDIKSASRPSVQGVIGNIGLPTLGLVNPAHVADLLAGALAGSISAVPNPAGTLGEHYRLKVSIEQTENRLKLTENERDARRQTLRILAVKGDVLPAEVWLGGDGALQKFTVTFTQEPVRRSKLKLALTIDFSKAAAPPAADALALPVDKQTVRVTSPAELVGPLRALQAGRARVPTAAAVPG
jgi:hypothetical protein